MGPREAAAAVLLQHKDEPEGLALLREQRAEGAPYCKVWCAADLLTAASSVSISSGIVTPNSRLPADPLSTKAKHLTSTDRSKLGILTT